MLDQFDNGFRPVRPGQRPGIDSLPDGEYTVVLEKAELATTKGGADLVRWSILVEGDMASVGYDHASFLSSQQNVNALGADLMAIGVPCDTWTTVNGKRFSVELPKALASLKGVRLSINKSSSTSASGKVYHNVRFLGRAGASINEASPEPVDIF